MIAIAIGWACGDIALLAFGSPIHRSTGKDIAVAMARSGYPLSRLAPASVDARGSTPWFASTAAGEKVFVKVLGRDERDADLVFRLYRYLRLKNVGDQRPFSDLRRTVEHEALLALKARDSGVRTPHLLTVATVEPDGLLLAYEMIEGKSLDGIPAPWSDELLHGIWQQVAILRRERIAHRDLRRANIFVDPDGTPWIIDFGFSELAATDDMLNQDAAQLLAATSIIVGPERAVATAVDVIGADAVGASLAYLQMPAFAGATREALKQQKGLLDSLRQTVIDTTGTAEIKYEPLNRISLRTVLMLVASLVAIYVLIPQLSDVEGMVRQLKDANWVLVFATLVFSFITYLGAGISLVAACPVPVRYGNAIEVSLAGIVREPHHAGRHRRHRPQPAVHAEGRCQHDRSRVTLGCERARRRCRPRHPDRDVLVVGGEEQCVRLPPAEDAAARGTRRGARRRGGRVPSSVRPPQAARTGQGRRAARAGRRRRHRARTDAARIDVPRWHDGDARLPVRLLRRRPRLRGHDLARGGRRRIPRGLRGRASGTDARRNRRGRSGADRGAGERRPRQGDRSACSALVPVGDVLDPDPSRLAVVHSVVARRRDLSGPVARPHVAVHLQRHLIMLAGAAAAFFVAFLIVDNNTVSVSDWEVDLTKWINDAPGWVARGLWPIMQLGTVWGPMVIGIVAIYVYGWRRGVAVIVSGIAAWFLAKYVKDIVSRGRPLHFIPTIDVREGKGTGLGFVSGHTAVAFAIATALLPVLSLRGRIIAYALASIVGLARIVYGVHFPLDVVGARPWESCAAASSTS